MEIINIYMFIHVFLSRDQWDIDMLRVGDMYECYFRGRFILI